MNLFGLYRFYYLNLSLDAQKIINYYLNIHRILNNLKWEFLKTQKITLKFVHFSI